MSALDTAAAIDRMLAPSQDWQARSLDRMQDAFRRMMQPQPLTRGRHRFPAPAVEALIEQENGHV